MTSSSAQVEIEANSGNVSIVDPGELLSRVIKNTFWLLNSSLMVRALNLMRGIILARLLLPGDFGLFGLASVVIGFAAMFNDVGAGVFLIYRQDSVKDHADTAFWTNLAMGTLLAGGVAAAAPLVGRFYGRPDVVPVLVVLAFSLWLQVGSTVHRNLLRKELRFRALAMIDAVVNVVSFGVAALLAWRGYGVWAFVIPHVVGNIINLLLFAYFQRWRPRWHFSRHSFAALAPFSGWYVAQAIVWYLVMNQDNLLVGKFLGMDALGLYGLAYNYALLPVTLVAGSLGGVIFPELARLLPFPSRFWSSYYQISRLMAGIICPIAAALYVTAPDLIPVLFGPKWNDAILPFQIIAVYGGVRCFWVDPLGALGRFDLSFWLGGATTVLGFFGICVGTRYGLAGVAWAVLIIAGGSHVAALYVASKSFARLVEGLRNGAPYFLTAVVAALAGLGARHLCMTWVSSRRELLALMTGSTVFAVYLLVFRSHLHRFATALVVRTTPVSERRA